MELHSTYIGIVRFQLGDIVTAEIFRIADLFLDGQRLDDNRSCVTNARRRTTDLLYCFALGNIVHPCRPFDQLDEATANISNHIQRLNGHVRLSR